MTEITKEDVADILQKGFMFVDNAMLDMAEVDGDEFKRDLTIQMLAAYLTMRLKSEKWEDER